MAGGIRGKRDYESAEATEIMALEFGLKPEEYHLFCQSLEHKPNEVELGVVAAMWSEHCSYKSSRRHLAKLPTAGECVIHGPGENAGVVDIGDGEAAIFKMESHNHPSFIEPYQGAATGVGGILRDVFTMGARPVALLNALRFGDPGHVKTPHLLRGVVAGIGDYGNCVGVPTVGGETEFDAGYNGNILVNAFALGIASQDKIFLSAAKGTDLPILYVGAKTGKDGIRGANMASEEFTPEKEDQRPTVQVGDPYREKLLIEACLELMREDVIIAIQDMGAAGLTSSSVEMATKGGVGMHLDLHKVPMREQGMTPYDLMLSESQERMLIILRPGKEAQLLARKIFDKWDLDVALIGHTTDSKRLELFWHGGKKVGDLPLAPLVEQAPNYDRPCAERPRPQTLASSTLGPPANYEQALLKMLSSAQLGSRRWIWEQYDHEVQTNTVAGPGGDAAIIRVGDGYKALALSADCTPRYCEADPFEGGKQAVAECWRNLISVGARPLAITNCLNFGNPERPEIMAQFVGCIEGMAAACRRLDFPVISGNVSLYNETEGQAIPPTPAIAGVGLLHDYRKAMLMAGANEGDQIYLLGLTSGWLGQSLYARILFDNHEGAPPPVSLEDERLTGEFLLDQAAQLGVRALHDLSDGGLLIGLAEFCTAAGVGADIRLSCEPDAAFAYLFGEDQGRYLAAVNPQSDFEEMARAKGVRATRLGFMSEDRLVVGDLLNIPLKVIHAARTLFFERYMEGTG